MYTFSGSFMDELVTSVPKKIVRRGGNLFVTHRYSIRLDDYWTHYLERRAHDVGLEP